MATRQNRNASSKKTILVKARALFYNKGYTSTSMRDIARACNFEPANIYNYFPSKEQLLYELMWDIHDLILSSASKYLETHNTASPVEQLRSLIKTLTNLVLSRGRSPRILAEVDMQHLAPAHRKEIIELRHDYNMLMCKVIRAGIDNGDFAKTDEKMAWYAIASMIVRTAIWFSPGERLSPDEIGDFLFEFAFNALRSDKKERWAAKTSA